MTGLYEQLQSIQASLGFFIPEFILSFSIVALLVIGLFKKDAVKPITIITLLTFVASLALLILNWPMYKTPVTIFNGMLRSDEFSAYLKMLIDIAGVLTVLMIWRHQKNLHASEYHALILTVCLGAHLLTMSMNFVSVFIALELISICSYILTAFSFSKTGAEGSQKYFLFGSVASAVMLYGFTFLYGFTGTFEFASPAFADALMAKDSTMIFIAGCMVFAGFFYKMAAAPLHPWAPDVYEAAPMPVVAFFSIVPKLAGMAIVVKFTLALNLFGQSDYDWQWIICLVSMISLTVGNFSALLQKRPKRLMAYSSIAQSGFLLVGIAAFVPNGINFTLFYATVYLLLNYVVFIYLQYFEKMGIHSVESFAGIGRRTMWPCVLLLVGFIGLTGLPPTAGFTAKFFIFSAAWEAYSLTGKPILLWLLVFGLLNTVISLFYYLRIPFFAFVKKAESDQKINNQTFENFFALLLVLAVLLLFFKPDLLMGWINKINFVL